MSARMSSRDTARIGVSGMAINTPLGDTIESFGDALLRGDSAISTWQSVDTSRIYARVGADLGDYDVTAKLEALSARLGDEVTTRCRRLCRRAPWSTQLSILLAADAWVDAGLHRESPDPARVAVVVGGHNINHNYQYENRRQFEDEPDFMDSMLSLRGLDTDHAGSISEALGLRGPIYTIGGACASANLALRSAIDEVLHHDAEVALVIGPVLEFSPVELHAMALMGAITCERFEQQPWRASRPFDVDRDGFVPAHGGGALIVERLERASARGAGPYAEILGVEASADGCHLPQPNAEGQAALIERLLHKSGVQAEEVDYVNAHATSTPLGDVTEIRALKKVFGAHAKTLKINATKSLIGHTCWSAPVVETIAAIEQMRRRRLHPTLNVERIEPEVDLDVCAAGAIAHESRLALKNSFGFGGINCVSLLRATANSSRGITP